MLSECKDECKDQKNNHGKKVTLHKEIVDYEELSNFISENNKMSSGNYTLLPVSQIKNFEKLNCLKVLMKGENKKLYGTIFSIPFPIQCNQEIITYGCTSFLNVHTKLRGFNMCKILINELTSYGQEKGIYCSYQLSSFKMYNSFPVSSWYRPIDLLKCLTLGFTFPGYNEIKKFASNKILYKCKTPKGYTIKKVKEYDEKAHKFYISMIKNKKFAFCPDLEFFNNWVNVNSTYIVNYDKNIVGIFSITAIHCKTSMTGKLCLPLIFNSLKNHDTNVLKCLLSTAQENQYDLLYTHSIGDLNENVLESVKSVKTKEDSWFSIYNNNIDLTPSDLYVPLF
jgi:hypothetical protein